MKNNRPIYIPSRAALLFLRLALPLVLLEGIVILISYLMDRQKDILLAFNTWSPALYDYLAAILTAVLLAIVVDAVELERKKRKDK